LKDIVVANNTALSGFLAVASYRCQGVVDDGFFGERIRIHRRAKIAFAFRAVVAKANNFSVGKNAIFFHCASPFKKMWPTWPKLEQGT
jgi:hypothetical protein